MHIYLVLKMDIHFIATHQFIFHFKQQRGDHKSFALAATFIFCKYTRNVYKSTVEISVQCKLSKLKMDITLNSFCTLHDKRDCHLQQQNKLAFIRRGNVC